MNNHLIEQNKFTILEHLREIIFEEKQFSVDYLKELDIFRNEEYWVSKYGEKIKFMLKNYFQYLI